MSGAVFTLGNSVSGSLGLGDAISKFGRVAATGLTIEQDPDTVNSYLTTRYAGLSAVTSGGVTTFLNPSLVIIPSAYNNGIVYSLHSKQVNTGDFTVTRNTEARRVNSAGRIASIGSGLPRLDYLTSGGTVGTPSLLVEPSGTNGILNSADTRTSWTLGVNLTSGAIDVIGVSGNNLTVAVSGSNISDAEGRLQRASNNVALASGSTYTLSFLMKKTGAHTIGGYVVVIDSDGNKVLGGNFDVSGSFSSGITTTNAPVDSRIRRVEQWGTDVYRCSETFRMTASGTLTSLRIGPTESVTSTSNSAVGTELGFAAPQIELGSVPTSFIPTTTGTVTRAADVISVSGAVSGSIGQTEGTMYIEAFIRKNTDAIFYSIMNTGISDAIYLQSASNGNLLANIRNSGTIVTLTIAAANWSEGYHKVAVAYKTGTGNAAICIDGGTPVTGTVVNIPTCVLVNLGSRPDSPGTLSINDRIRAVALYTTRLTNAELATLTTP